MSNTLAIAATTAALKQLLQAAVDAGMSGARVTTMRPAAVATATADPTLNIFLYQVAPNAALRNSDLPTRRADGTLVQRPRVALDLHYLLSFSGAEATVLEPQRLLGCAVAALQAHPTLSRELIAQAIRGTDLEDSDLAEQVEAIRVVPLSLNLEELSKLWSVFFQTPYVLSMAYQASVVLIDAALTPQRALPVRKADAYAAPFRQPRISRVRVLRTEDQAPKPANAPILAGDMLLIEGEHLLSDNAPLSAVQVELGEVAFTPEAGSDVALRVTLRSHRLRAGAQGLQVAHLMALGDPPTPHRVVTSDAVALTVRPTIAQIALHNVSDGGGLYDADLVVACVPGIGRRQHAALLLNEVNPPAHRTAHAYRFDAPPLPTIGAVSDAVAAATARAARFTAEPERSAAGQVAQAAADAVHTADASLATVRSAMDTAVANVAAGNYADEDERQRAVAAAGVIADSIDGADEIVFPIRRVSPTDYFVRVQIGGVESPLTISNEQFVGPKVTIP